MSKIVGIDLGTNSIGISLRNTDLSNNVVDQLEYFDSIIFKSGVGKGKSGEVSYSAERTKKRSTRRLYQARKYRIWETLKLLIEDGYCPLSIEDLEKWSKYDKQKGLKRQYPVDAEKFEQWVRLDFDGDGKADYSSPFQLRAELVEKQFDFSKEADRYKLGRALYHIAQRRGFKSSKGETIKEQEANEQDSTENAEIDVVDALKKSEEKKSGKLVEFMKERGLKTVGAAFYELEKTGIRVRREYQAVRSQYKEEIKQIFEFQNGLDSESVFYKRLVSEKKGEGTIFYKRPLRSQKGSVGNCTLEPGKPRCPISHPEFEKFRALCLINNIRFGEGLKETLTAEQKKRLYDERFLLTRSGFKFEDIQTWIEKEIHKKLSYKDKTINYKDSTNIAGCPVSARLKKLLGDDWESWKIESIETKVNKKTGEIKNVTYTALDLWHICFSFDEPDYIEEFAQKKLGFNNEQTKQLVRIYGAIQQGYGLLSLKAIRNINRFLEKGLIYSDAVLLAKLPDLFGDRWVQEEENIIERLDALIEENRHTKQLYNITNSLIADYKSLDISEQFAYKNQEYKLAPSDYDDIRKAAIGNIGDKTWAKKSKEDQESIVAQVAVLYQDFFSSQKREYYILPKISDALAGYLSSKYEYIKEKDLRKIYHPSMIEIYPHAKDQRIEDGRNIKLLGSPVIGALKNPMAMRVLHTLRKQMNSLLKSTDENGNALIDENTRVVVETARELNDANMRWAIKKYQDLRAEENKEYEMAILELLKDKEFSGSADSKNPDDIDKIRLWMELSDSEIVSKLDSKGKPLAKTEEGWKTYGYTTKKVYSEILRCKNDIIKKYRLWKEQNFMCLYTGKPISLSQLFSPNCVDFEHTIPRSISFDDSLANLTICDAHFNRTIKKNQMPTQLVNYDEIKQRLQPWFEKVERLKDNVAYWKAQSRRAQDKDRKDQCIRQRHLWQMELDYWQNKVDRFTMTEVTSGFKNSQLVDTRIITKYAYHYLKTVFSKVDVQKGSVTANFRKMLGIQSIDEKKSRDKHSHHAIDATMLTLVPVAAKRDKMLELFYKIQEKKRLGENASSLENDLRKEIVSCGLGGNISEVAPFIESNILINHISKDQTLTPSHKRKRVRGRIVPKRDENGNILYELNEDGTFKLDKLGHKIPQAKEWITGDCIRGKLHGETYYGAITQAQKDENGKILRDENGKIIVGEEKLYVVRRELVYKKDQNSPGFKNWDELKEAVVDKSFFDIIKGQFEGNMSFKDACASGIYMYRRNEKGVMDFSEKCKVNRIRHIRCFTSIKKPLQFKKQTYLSDKDYKQYYYAEMGDLYVMCRYESEDKVIKEYRIWSLYDVSNNRKTGLEDIPTTMNSKKKNVALHLTEQLNSGDMLLIYKESPQELYEMDKDSLSQRLYVVRGFENPSLIKLVKHINAQEDKDLGKGESIKNYSNMPEKIRCGISTLKYLIKDKDFYLTPKGVVFKNDI